MRATTIFPTLALATLIVSAPAMAATPILRGKLGPIGEGRRMWLQFNCYNCHGDKAGGGMGPDVNHADGGDVRAAVLHGDAMEGGMRSFAKYATAKDVTNITAYLKSIGTGQEPTWLDWWNSKP
jgi:cytochrome c551